MADVFISYARADLPWVTRLVTVLQQSAMSVFWDPDIRAGADFRQTLENELTIAKCVLVVWSPRSVKSVWVADEAAVGASRRALVPILTEKGLLPPLGLRAFQALDLSRWTDERQPPPALEALLRELRARLDRKVPDSPPVRPPPPPRRLGYLALGVLVVGGVSGAIWAARPTPGPDGAADAGGDLSTARDAPEDTERRDTAPVDVLRISAADARSEKRRHVARKPRDAGAYPERIEVVAVSDPHHSAMPRAELLEARAHDRPIAGDDHAGESWIAMHLYARRLPTGRDTNGIDCIQAHVGSI